MLITHGGYANENSRITLSNDPVFDIKNYLEWLIAIVTLTSGITSPILDLRILAEKQNILQLYVKYTPLTH